MATEDKGHERKGVREREKMGTNINTAFLHKELSSCPRKHLHVLPNTIQSLPQYCPPEAPRLQAGRKAKQLQNVVHLAQGLQVLWHTEVVPAGQCTQAGDVLIPQDVDDSLQVMAGSTVLVGTGGTGVTQAVLQLPWGWALRHAPGTQRFGGSRGSPSPRATTQQHVQ